MATSVIEATIEAALIASPSDVNLTNLDDDYHVRFWINTRTGASLTYWWQIYSSVNPTFLLQGASDSIANAVNEANEQLAIIYA